MPKFSVLVTQDATISTTVTVDAEDRDAAIEAALEETRDKGYNHTWTVDDGGGNWKPFIADYDEAATEIEPEPPVPLTKYKVQFVRDYTVQEGFSRIIEAPSKEEAIAAALGLATEFNDDCPDDCSEIEGQSGSTGFDAEIPEVYTGREIPDYTVQDDGQVVPYDETQADAEA